MKQSKLRRRRVIRYAILYFVMLIVFIGLIVGPLVAGKNIPTKDISNSLKGPLAGLVQPVGLNNDDTLGQTETGVKAPGYTGAGTSTRTTAVAQSSAAATTAGNKIRFF
jgi:1,3-beta-glucan synthase